ncbi:hypothetical protein NQ318_022653 [Aromia moschata]|uniref:Uncharacterized protein n=1 Tax=Aromia moschata TaxID=1265417 RepID=A0AAV8YNE4_9CUCU|nr:hypothetical protein NQ318_022653 [Aromia moschata]
MKLFVALLFLLICCVHFSYANPRCYNQICPSATTSCKKNVRSSFDRTKLEIRINCLDDYDGSLKEYYFEEPSSMNPHTHYESSSYAAAEGIADNNNYYRNTNGLEDLY